MFAEVWAPWYLCGIAFHTVNTFLLETLNHSYSWAKEGKQRIWVYHYYINRRIEDLGLSLLYQMKNRYFGIWMSFMPRNLRWGLLSWLHSASNAVPDSFQWIFTVHPFHTELFVFSFVYSFPWICVERTLFPM